MDPKEQRYWQTKWEDSTNVVTVMEALLHTQAVQMEELKTKNKGLLKSREEKVAEIEQLKRCVSSLREKLKQALGRRNVVRKQAA